MKCNWTENDTKVSYNSYDLPYYKIIECNSTNTTRDKHNVNERYFCEIHLKQVKETRKLMHKNCISKEKIILDINKIINDTNPHRTYTEYVFYLKERIENGEFDND
ncbi:hypothetical protein [Spiroplasma endosymbiont of Notiophilus biguttatus]|uniref:hypothetical protein n=1 Tax=Spiroplasma endosymbiont of Notiophilus biguttatus TaxID=3066285 RepID=UPI00313CF9CD